MVKGLALTPIEEDMNAGIGAGYPTWPLKYGDDGDESSSTVEGCSAHFQDLRLSPIGWMFLLRKREAKAHSDCHGISGWLDWKLAVGGRL